MCKITTTLDTLEITDILSSSTTENEALELSGDGKNTTQNLLKRNAMKYINNQISRALADVNETKRKAYWDTYYCSSKLVAVGEKVKSEFCGRRWCIICNRIRTSQLLKAYLPTLQDMPDKQFVTLTIPNVPAAELRQTITDMYKNFRAINLGETQRKNKIIGVRKLEVTYNRFRNDYHPHYHFIVSSKATGDRLIQKWLEKYPTATRICQDIRKADDKSCFELFKYFTKLKSNATGDKFISIHALNNIINSIDGVRTFQPFGIKKIVDSVDKSVNKEIDETEAKIMYLWDEKIKTWIDKDTGETLVNYKPGVAEKLFEKRIIRGRQLFD